MTKTKPKTELYGLELEDIEIIHNILGYYPTVETVMVFGSRAKGSYGRVSDLDLVIIGTGQDQANSIIGDIRQSDFLLSVDIIGYDATNDNELLKSEIDNYNKVFWTRSEDMIDHNQLQISQKDPFFDKSRANILIQSQYQQWINQILTIQP